MNITKSNNNNNNDNQLNNSSPPSPNITPNIFGPILSDIKHFINHQNQQQQQANVLSIEKCWTYVHQLVTLINQHCEAIKQQKQQKQQRKSEEQNEQTATEMISTQTLNDYKTGLELIVVWGIIPRLCRGIGIDIKKRIDPKTKQFLSMNNQNEQNDHVGDEMDENEKLSFENCEKLLTCVHALLDISYHDSLIRQIVYDYYFVDVISAYIQLIYMKKPKNIVEMSDISNEFDENCKDGDKMDDSDDSEMVVTCVDVTQLSENASPAHLYQLERVRRQGCHTDIMKRVVVVKQYGFDRSQTEQIAKEFDRIMKRIPELVVARSLLLLVSESSSSSSCAKWFSNLCSSFLSIMLTRPKGVFAVTHCLLEDIPESHLPKYERVVQLVLKKPQKCATLDMYYGFICPQILRMLRLRGQKFAHITRAAQLYAGTIVQQEPELAQKHILEPMMRSLFDFMKFGSVAPEHHRMDSKSTVDDQNGDDDDNGIDDEKDVLVSETELGQCIEDIHHLLHGNAPTPVLFNCITQVMPAIFQLYCFVSRTKLNLKSACEEIISSYFKISDKALEVIKSLLVFERNKFSTYCIFAGGSSGGVCIKRVSQTNRDYMWEARCMIELLKIMKNESVAGDLFVHLMTQFTLLEQRIDQVNNDLKQSLGAMNETYLPEENVIILQMLQLIMEELGPSIMKNTLQTIVFIKFLLLKHEHGSTENDFEMITMGLGILSTIICGSIPVRTAEEEHALTDIQPILKRLATGHTNEQVSEMCATANLGIEAKQYRQYADAPPELTEEEQTEMRLRAILNDLKDPLLPVRGHGITSLQALVLEKGNSTVRKYMKNILRIFQTQLKDSDSYVYLAAIRGLSAMADVFPDEIIPIITDSFEDQKMPCAERVKLGESMVEIIARCGELLPKYAQQFIFSLLKCAREQPRRKSNKTTTNSKVNESSNSTDFGDEVIPLVNDDSAIVRASSLSNLSDVVDVLKYGMHPYVTDILTTASTILEMDTSYHVRRAAVHIFSRLVNSLGTNLFNLFFTEDELSKVHYGVYEDANPVTEVIRVLKRAETYDKDNMVRINAKTVLLEIEDIIYDILTPKDKLSEAHRTVKFR